ncbi:hypothetical protein AB5I41_17440 [Sphingomonas sp. MMS24-JH45]
MMTGVVAREVRPDRLVVDPVPIELRPRHRRFQAYRPRHCGRWQWRSISTCFSRCLQPGTDAIDPAQSGVLVRCPVRGAARFPADRGRDWGRLVAQFYYLTQHRRRVAAIRLLARAVEQPRAAAGARVEAGLGCVRRRTRASRHRDARCATKVYGETIRYTLQGIALYGIFAFILRPNRLTSPILNHPAMQLIGRYSYALDLVHVLIFVVRAPPRRCRGGRWRS